MRPENGQRQAFPFRPSSLAGADTAGGQVPLRPAGIRAVFLLVSLLVFIPPVQGSEANDVVFYAVGDIMLGRYIGKIMTTNGGDYPFREMSQALHRGDIVFGNLEAVISDGRIAPFYPGKPYSFHASSDAAPVLNRAGFHVLSLANNHAMDYGAEPLLNTQLLLSRQGIAAFGAGKDLGEARKPVIMTRKGVRFAFLGYGVAHSRSVYATAKSAGISPIILESVRNDIRSLRKEADVIIVSLHWGMEYDASPSRLQREEAHRIIDWGADMIIGHHPHVMQGIEIYKNRVIAYSLGNFVFDQRGHGTDWSIILACTFRGKALHSVEAIPLGRFRSYFPKVAEGKTRTRILKDVVEISSPLNRESTAVSNVVFKR